MLRNLLHHYQDKSACEQLSQKALHLLFRLDNENIAKTC